MLARLRKQLTLRRILGASVGVLISLGLLALAFDTLLLNDSSTINFTTLLERLQPQLLLTFSLFYGLLVGINVIGWGSIMGRLTGIWRWDHHFRIFYLANLTRRVPGTVWYLFGRVILYERLQVPRSTTLFGTGVEAATIILGGLSVVVLTWPLALANTGLHPLWLLAAVIVGIAIVHPRFLRRLLQRISPQTAATTVNYRWLGSLAAIYALIWCGGGVLLFLLAQAVYALPLNSLPAVMGAWAASGVVVYTFSFMPFGFGMQELTLTALLAPLLGPGEAVVIALLMRVTLTLNEVLWALIALGLGVSGISRLPKAEESTEKPA